MPSGRGVHAQRWRSGRRAGPSSDGDVVKVEGGLGATQAVLPDKTADGRRATDVGQGHRHLGPGAGGRGDQNRAVPVAAGGVDDLERDHLTAADAAVNPEADGLVVDG